MNPPKIMAQRSIVKDMQSGNCRDGPHIWHARDAGAVVDVREWVGSLTTGYRCAGREIHGGGALLIAVVHH
jgi:hypothetical protein